jgi:hypothetical protein
MGSTKKFCDQHCRKGYMVQKLNYIVSENLMNYSFSCAAMVAKNFLCLLLKCM